jgi:hypothetical protein
MQSIPRQDVPVAIVDGELELRVQDHHGLMVGFVRLPAGADLRPPLKGMPDDLCPCPHWGYMLKGRVGCTRSTATRTSPPGEAFYWGPGHAPRRSRPASTSTSPRRTSSSACSTTHGRGGELSARGGRPTDQAVALGDTVAGGRRLRVGQLPRRRGPRRARAKRRMAAAEEQEERVVAHSVPAPRRGRAARLVRPRAARGSRRVGRPLHMTSGRRSTRAAAPGPGSEEHVPASARSSDSTSTRADTAARPRSTQRPRGPPLRRGKPRGEAGLPASG